MKYLQILFILIGLILVIVDFFLSDTIKEKIPVKFENGLKSIEVLSFKHFEILIANKWIMVFGSLLINSKHKINSYLPYSLIRQNDKFNKNASEKNTIKKKITSQIKEIKISIKNKEIELKKKYSTKKPKFYKQLNLEKNKLKELEDKKNNYKSELIWPFILIIIPIFSFVLYWITVYYNERDYWFLGILSLTFVVKAIYDILYQPRNVIAEIYNYYKLDAHKIYAYGFFSSIVSIFSVIIINIVSIEKQLNNNLFISLSNGYIIPHKPILFALFHFIFISISIYIILKGFIYMLSKKKMMSTIGILIFLATFFISILFYTILCYFDNPDIMMIFEYLKEAFQVIISIITFNQISHYTSEYLLGGPTYLYLILSTFLPLFVYLSLYFIIALAKSIINIVSYIFKRIIEKKITILTRIGAVMGAFAGLLKISTVILTEIKLIL